MAESRTARARRRFVARHRGRSGQVWIYLGKFLRMFVYQSDWKVLPMAALIAGLVGMVVHKEMFLNMEGTLIGAFALVCVGIWNGCFNSIQVICRERDVIKREHRSGMHISAYVLAHMLYQLMLCAAQTGITLYVIKLVGVQFPDRGLFTPWLIVDMGLSLLLITYASDMLSLWVSSLARTTTTAMTIMPFVLIFQLVFSGGMLDLPNWTEPLTRFTISNPGLKLMAAQADINNRPFVTISGMVSRMRDSEIGGEITLGQALDLLTDAENPAVAQIRALEVAGEMTVGELRDLVYGSKTLEAHRADPLTDYLTIGDALTLLDASGFWTERADEVVGSATTLGDIIDQLAANPDVQARREEKYAFSTTLGSLIDMAGEDNVRTFLEDKAAEVSFRPEYELTKRRVAGYWLHLMAFIAVFALLATVTLEFIDRDRR